MALSIPELPKTQRAVVANDELEFSIRDDFPMPPIADDCVIIKTEYVGLNPVDTKMVGPFAGAGANYGIDCSGTVVAMGKYIAAEGRIKLGDRVCGACDGMEALRPQSGAFAEYASVDGIMALKMPDSMSFEVGACMPLRIATSVMAIFHSLQLPMELLKKPAEQPFPILVYGGATSTGTCAIQILKRMGARVITTCSPHSNDLVRSYGADEVFDYHDAICGADIRALTNNALDYAIDCITEEGTMKICYQALGRCGGKYVGLEPYPEQSATRRAVSPDWVLATHLRGLPISWPEPFGTPGKDECADFKRAVWPYMNPIFESDELKPHPIRLEPDGFEGLLDGVALLRKGKVRGEKLIYRTADRRQEVSAAS